jgi:hypothetical protein
MKFILSISLLLFMLMPEAAVSAIMGSTPSETSGSNNKTQWLEEETETETISSLTERVIQKIGGTAGGSAIEQKPFTTLYLAAFRSRNSPNASGWVFISKYPRYIQFCCLKLDCCFILS